MGVDIKFVTVYGVQFDESDPEIQAFKESYLAGDDVYDRMESTNLPHWFDSYDSSFFIFGHAFLETASMRWDCPDGHVQIDLDPELLAAYRYEYIKKFIETFPEHAGLIRSKPWKIISFTYYT